MAIGHPSRDYFPSPSQTIFYIKEKQQRRDSDDDRRLEKEQRESDEAHGGISLSS